MATSNTSDTNQIELLKKMALGVSIVSVLVILGSLSYHFGFSSGAGYVRENTPPVTPRVEIKYVQIPAKSDTLGESTIGDNDEDDVDGRKSKSITLTSTQSLDGYRSSREKGSNRREIRVGRNVELATRGFVSFDITDLPQGAEIESAKLKVYQVRTIGTPYKIGGEFLVDHLNYGNKLNSEDYALAALISGYGELDSGDKDGWKVLDVTSALTDDIANARSTSQYRLHMSKELSGGNDDGDFVMIESSENYLKTGKRPQLVVKYLQ